MSRENNRKSSADLVETWLGTGDGDSPQRRATLLAVCPVSPAVVDANLVAAESSRAPAIFAATLNQVDTDGGYTGWKPEDFVRHTSERARHLAPNTPLVFCLDHGGPWKKDVHHTSNMLFEETWSAVQRSIQACLEAGYEWLHIDATVDPLVSTMPLPTAQIVERTVGLMTYAESVRSALDAGEIIYETGIEETGSLDGVVTRLNAFLSALSKVRLRDGLPAPRFAVCNLGTRLDGTDFDRGVADAAVAASAAHEMLIKAHYSDDLANPQLYPVVGIGGANIGPGLAARELDELSDLETRCTRAGARAGYMDALFHALDASGRWRKWVEDAQSAKTLHDVPKDRRRWLLRTGARYVFNTPDVRDARARLAEVVRNVLEVDLEAAVTSRLAAALATLYRAFNLEGAAESDGAG